MKEKKSRGKSTGREILEWVLTILAAVLMALPVKAFAFEFVRVDGESMNTTLADGEVMFVSKLDYATTWLTLPWQDAETKEKAKKIVTGGDPQRFDVVICRYPGRGDTNFVKRIVGVPGDTIELRNGFLYVNGDRYEEAYIAEEFRKAGGSNGWSYGPFTVPDGEYFVMGDHRNNSNDSRAQGTITQDMIIGHVRSVIYPFGEGRKIE